MQTNSDFRQRKVLHSSIKKYILNGIEEVLQFISGRSRYFRIGQNRGIHYTILSMLSANDSPINQAAVINTLN